jgi:hypothetical protein
VYEIANRYYFTYLLDGKLVCVYETANLYYRLVARMRVGDGKLVLPASGWYAFMRQLTSTTDQLQVCVYETANLYFQM